MNKDKVVLFEKKGRIAYITLNRPEKLNAINGEMMLALAEAVNQYSSDSELWCAILSGAGKCFSTGGDISWIREQQIAANEPVPKPPGGLSSYYRSLRDCVKPVISAIHGYCIAGGMSLAIFHSDIHIASEDAIFGMPAARWSVTYPYRLPLTWYVSLSNALYIVLTCKEITAEEALRIGLVSEVVPRDKLLARAKELAEMVCENSPIDVRAYKEYLYRFLETCGAFGDTLADMVFQKVLDSEDVMEGACAFVEKRKPQWRNK